MVVSGWDRPTGVQNKRLAVQHTPGDKERGKGPVLEPCHVGAFEIIVVIKLGEKNIQNVLSMETIAKYF